MTRDEVVNTQTEEAPKSAQSIVARAFSGDASPRAAIKAKCLTCTGYDRAAITTCTGWTCPLWAYRPFQKAEGK